MASRLWHYYQYLTATEVAKGGTQCRPTATLVGQPRSGAQVLVRSTKTNFRRQSRQSCHIVGVRG